MRGWENIKKFGQQQRKTARLSRNLGVGQAGIERFGGEALTNQTVLLFPGNA
jgi:hypothetical protein